jgi:hypothetical protein
VLVLVLELRRLNFRSRKKDCLAKVDIVPYSRFCVVLVRENYVCLRWGSYRIGYQLKNALSRRERLTGELVETRTGDASVRVSFSF